MKTHGPGARLMRIALGREEAPSGVQKLPNGVMTSKVDFHQSGIVDESTFIGHHTTLADRRDSSVIFAVNGDPLCLWIAGNEPG